MSSYQILAKILEVGENMLVYQLANESETNILEFVCIRIAF